MSCLEVEGLIHHVFISPPPHCLLLIPSLTLLIWEIYVIFILLMCVLWSHLRRVCLGELNSAVVG